jgi:ribosomal protein L19E
VLPWGVTFDARHMSEEEWAETRKRIRAELQNLQRDKKP